jgi:hypothetical protein
MLIGRKASGEHQAQERAKFITGRDIDAEYPQKFIPT